MFAGVLDGGAKEVFLGGTRLKRFMESVETATGSVATRVEAGGIAHEQETTASETTAPIVRSADTPPAAVSSAGAPLSREAAGELLTLGAKPAAHDRLSVAWRASSSQSAGRRVEMEAMDLLVM
jgi:hypothetical protein